MPEPPCPLGSGPHWRHAFELPPAGSPRTAWVCMRCGYAKRPPAPPPFKATTSHLRPRPLDPEERALRAFVARQLREA